MPFYFVQLAAYDRNWFEFIREQQLAALHLPGTGFVTAMDLGDQSSPRGSIHPRRKHQVARRLAGLALAEQYRRPVRHLGPRLVAVEGNASAVELRFANADGLHFHSTGGCFEAAVKVSNQIVNIFKAN